MTPIDKAKQNIIKFLPTGHLYKNYINNDLAGDFAYDLSEALRAMQERQSVEALPMFFGLEFQTDNSINEHIVKCGSETVRRHLISMFKRSGNPTTRPTTKERLGHE